MDEHVLPIRKETLEVVIQESLVFLKATVIYVVIINIEHLKFGHALAQVNIII